MQRRIAQVPPRPVPRFLRGLWALFAALALLSVSLHHHSDVSEHDDCPACVVQHASTAPDAEAILPILPAGSRELLCDQPAAGVPARQIPHGPSRGPPSLA